MNSEVTLLPCPFCGLPDIDNDEGCFPRGNGGWCITCGNPSCHANVLGNTRGETVAAWNRRTAPPSSGEVVGVTVGWALVPIEPTQEMLDAVTAADQHEPFSDKTMAHTYRTMLSAAPKQAMGWRPIESAPRDGTRVLLYFAGLDHVEDATITEDGYCLFDGESFNQPPTHWQPLDELPKEPQS